MIAAVASALGPHALAGGPGNRLESLRCDRWSAAFDLRLAGPALSLAKLRSGKSQAKRPGSRLRADSLQSFCRPLGRSPRVMFGNRPRQGCRSRGCRTGCSQIRRGTDVVMSGIVESGRESGHGDIDANDPQETLRAITVGVGWARRTLGRCSTNRNSGAADIRSPRCFWL